MGVWSALSWLASCLTLSPGLIDRQRPQHPLPGSITPVNNNVKLGEIIASAVSYPLSPLATVPATPIGEGPHFPVFKPPEGRPKWDGSDFMCEYPKMVDWEPCSTREDRTCWLRHTKTGKTFNITSDYESLAETPVGITRNYTLVIEDGDWNTDGLISRDMKLVNGTYPGPWIQACWGDTLNVKVINKLNHNGTAVHFHGIRQNQTMHMDGVPGITQCPIAPNDYFVYKFRVTQYGSSWYHSHYSVQYADGLLGPMTLHGPSSDNWDEPKTPILMSDWFHNSAFSVIHGKKAGYPTTLLNGTGDITKYQFTDKETGQLFNVIPNAPIPAKYQLHFVNKTKTETGKARRYLLRLINTSFATTFLFSIDHHRIIVIGADFVPVEPKEGLTHLQVGIGQRYTIVVVAEPERYANANSTNPGWIDKYPNFWIRTTIVPCFKPEAIGIPEYDKTGILRYNPDDVREPTTKPWPSIVNVTCYDEANLVPKLKWNVTWPKNGSPFNSSSSRNESWGEHFGAQRKQLEKPLYPLASWSFEPKASELSFQPLQIDYDDPFFLRLNEVNNTNWPAKWVVVPENYTAESWVFLAITNIFQAAHPIHLHGHDFAVIQQEYNAAWPPKNLDKFNLTNPLRRDVVLLPKLGWVVIAFKTDNPGAWIMHCHIAFHASEGLALQINERQGAANTIWPNNDKTGEYDSEIIEAKRVCKRWKDFQHDCTQHWPGKNETGNCWPACRADKKNEKMFACKQDDLPGHVFQDDSGI